MLLKTKCQACDNVSQTYEMFADLSLDFPSHYHATNDDMSSACTDACNLTGQSQSLHCITGMSLYFSLSQWSNQCSCAVHNF